MAEQTRRLEEVFAMLDQRPRKEPSPVIEGILEASSSLGSSVAQEVKDVTAAKTASDLVQFSMQTLGVMLRVAEQAGITNASPRIADALEVSIKEHKKLEKDLKRLNERLVEQLRPS
jgi:ferritin-like metal-binding protein YciE